MAFAALVYYELRQARHSSNKRLDSQNDRLDRLIEITEEQKQMMTGAMGKMGEFAINTRECLQRIEVRQGNGHGKKR